MFALIAAIIFFLAVFGVKLGTVNLLYLGLAFLSLHFVVTVSFPVLPFGRRQV